MITIKHILRQFARSPGFTCVAVLTLGLCIGANLTIFAVLDAIVIRALPFPDPDRLVVVHNEYPGAGIERGGASVANYFDRRDAIDAFESVTLYRKGFRTIGEGDAARRGEVAAVTPEFFPTLGLPFALGTTFSEEDFDGGRKAVISDRCWRNYFNADPNVLGMTMTIDSYRVTVIGVLRPGFRYLSSDAEVYSLWGRFSQETLAGFSTREPRPNDRAPP